MTWSNNRLTVVGAKAPVQKFAQSHWLKALGGRHCELLQNSPGRWAWQFESDNPPLEPLRRLSRCCPQLCLLLEWESETMRTKGLAKACAGNLDHCQLGY